MQEHTAIDRRAYIVDDDLAIRTLIRRILTDAGIYCEEFDCGESLLEDYAQRPLGCILLDVRLPGINGLELLSELRTQIPPNPVVMVSGHGDVPLAVSAVKSGAIDFVEKPFRKERLLEIVDAAFDYIGQLQNSPVINLGKLSNRERQVLQAFSGGTTNKLVAYQLDLSIRTVEMHRARILRKLNVKNLTQALLLVQESGDFN